MPRRRWLQFSLRTALVFTVLWAVLLSVSRVYLGPFLRQKSAILRLREKGVAVFWYDKNVRAPFWGAWLLGDESFRQALEGVELPPGITDDDLRELTADLIELPWLARLRIPTSRVTDAGLEHLKGLLDLETLSMDQSAVRGEGFRHLSAMRRLWRVTTNGNPLTDEAVRWLGQCRALRELRLMDTQITDACLPDLKGLDRLECLLLPGSAVTDAGLHHLNHLPMLRYVNVDRTAVTEAGVNHLKSLPRMRDIKWKGGFLRFRHSTSTSTSRWYTTADEWWAYMVEEDSAATRKAIDRDRKTKGTTTP